MSFAAIAEFTRLITRFGNDFDKDLPEFLKTRQQSGAEDDALLSGSNGTAAEASIMVNRGEEAVAKMLQAKMDELMISHPLRSFGSHLVVWLIHHKKDETIPKRRMVVMRDSIRYPQFRDWVQICIWGVPSSSNSNLILQFVNEFGDSVTINSGSSLAQWLDVMWYKHPPELHIYEVESLLLKQQATLDAAQELFALYDADGSGKIEIREMLMAKEMADMLGLSRDVLLEFHTDMFRQMDTNKDGVVTYDEFVSHFNRLNTTLRNGLAREGSKSYSTHRLECLSLEAQSYRVSLEEVVTRPPLNIEGAVTMRGGRLFLDANEGCDYAVELRFTHQCLTDQNRKKWVQASTILEQKVDHFVDSTRGNGQQMGRLASALVLVEFEPGVQLGADYELCMPHCFCEVSTDLLTGVTDPLEKEDLVVVTADLNQGIWHPVPQEDFELVPAEEAPLGLPAVKVRLRQGGVVGVFSVANAEVDQRVQCVAFTKEVLMPLEPEELSIYIAPDLPNAIEEVVFNETQERGLVKLVGWSEVVSVCARDTLMSVSVRYGNEAPQTKELKWDGNLCRLVFIFDPEEWGTKAEAEVEGIPMEATYSVDVGLRTTVGRRRGQFAKPDKVIKFDCRLQVHNFPPPAAPVNLAVKSRNQVGVALTWTMPDEWGGCALNKYELELRRKTKEGKMMEWERVDERPGYALSAYVYQNIYAGELRVRATNVGSLEAGPWSNVVVLEPEKAKSGEADAPAPAPKQGKSKKREMKLSREESMQDEGGVAVISQQEIESRLGKKFQESTNMDGWSEFCKVIGNFYLEVGVWGGVGGKLFELTPQRVEQLSKGSQSSNQLQKLMIAKNPLIALASCAVWVLDTLAHHTANSELWIETLNSIEGMIVFAAHETSEDASGIQTENIRSILYLLIQVYETMRQCDPGGYITHQLGHRYNKMTRETLRAEMDRHIEQLKCDIACEASEMALNNARLRMKSHTSSMKLTFEYVLQSIEPVVGALGLKARFARERHEIAKISVGEVNKQRDELSRGQMRFSPLFRGYLRLDTQVTFFHMGAERLPRDVKLPQLEFFSVVASEEARTLLDSTTSRRNPTFVGQQVGMPLKDKFHEFELEKPLIVKESTSERAKCTIRCLANSCKHVCKALDHSRSTMLRR